MFKQFINLYIFFTNAKKYSNISNSSRNNEIYKRTKHIVNDIAFLKTGLFLYKENFLTNLKTMKILIQN